LGPTIVDTRDTLHDKPVPLSDHPAAPGYTKLFVYCSNPDCHHNAVVDANEFPDDIAYNDVQPRIVCTSAIIAARTCARLGMCPERRCDILGIGCLIYILVTRTRAPLNAALG
jgi:hypothetical protein